MNSPKTAPTPSDFSIAFPIHGNHSISLKATLAIRNIGEMMSAMGGQEFGTGLKPEQPNVSQKILEVISDYFEEIEQQNQQLIAAIRLRTLNKILHAGIPELLVYMRLQGGHGQMGQGPCLLLQDECCSPFIGTVVHDFPDVPRALVVSKAITGPEELTPLTNRLTAQPLKFDQAAPQYIEKPITQTTVYPRDTRLLYSMPVLNEERLRNPDIKDVELVAMTDDIRNRLSGTELFFLRFLKDEQTAQSASVQQATQQAA